MERPTRYSKKREAILEAIRSTDCHPSAEWVYRRLKSVHPDLSLGTVYRNLVFFQERGDVRCVGVVRGQERFDAITTPHSHFVCERCGAVIDLEGVCLDRDVPRAVSEQYGLTVDRHELIFYGACKNCRQTNQHFKEETAS